MRQRKKMKRGIALAVIVALGASCWYGINSRNNENIPELTSYIDNMDSDSNTVVVEEKEVPLADVSVTTKNNTTTTTTTSTKTTKKTVKLKKAATKTYKVKKPTKTKTTTKTTKKTAKTVTIKTTEVTSIVESYTKKSKEKVVTTKVKTTIQTTTTKISTKTPTNETTATTVAPTEAILQILSIDDLELAKNADKRLVNAYKTLGFSITIDSSVSYSGYFTARLRSITLRKNDDTIYHELGHFLAFIAGNVDIKSDFTAVYSEEKSKFTGINKAYSTQNSSEYFAESYKNYVENPSELKKTRPKTYESIVKALNVITDEHLQRVQKVYGPIWKE